MATRRIVVVALFVVALAVASTSLSAASDVAAEKQACYDSCFVECKEVQKESMENCTKICGFMRSLGCRSPVEGSDSAGTVRHMV